MKEYLDYGIMGFGLAFNPPAEVALTPLPVNLLHCLIVQIVVLFSQVEWQSFV